MVSIESLFETIQSFFVTQGPMLLYALITLVIGWWIIKWIVYAVKVSFTKRDLDPSLKHFITSFLGVVLKVALLISVISMVGVETTSFIAILGAAGLAVGFAMQGALSNLAGGLLILFFKPFEVGHFISAQGYLGTIEKIELINTTLKAPDNTIIILPNGMLANSGITNYSIQETRRFDITIGISYDDDISKARKALLDLLKSDSRILKEPEPIVRVSEYADSAINLSVRGWTKSDDFWTVYFEILGDIKGTLDKAKVTIPYPQRDIHIHDKK